MIKWIILGSIVLFLVIIEYIGIFMHYPKNVHTLIHPLFIILVTGVLSSQLLILDILSNSANSDKLKIGYLIIYAFLGIIILSYLYEAVQILRGKQIIKNEIKDKNNKTIHLSEFRPNIKRNKNWVEDNVNNENSFYNKDLEEMKLLNKGNDWLKSNLNINILSGEKEKDLKEFIDENTSESKRIFLKEKYTNLDIKSNEDYIGNKKVDENGEWD